MKDISNTSRNLWLGLVIISIILVAYPRFDRQDLFGIDAFTVGGKPAQQYRADSHHYENHVLYFRGEADPSVLKEPWAYRPIPTFVASWLPFSASTSINLLNYLAMIIGLIFLAKSMLLIGISNRATVIGGFLYSISFPVFYYGTIGYIDAVLVGMLCISLHLILSKRPLLFSLLFLAGALVKETFIVILPAYAAYQLLVSRRAFWPTLCTTIALATTFVVLLYLVRILTPVEADYLWLPNSERIELNLFRSRSWLSFALAFGPAGVLASGYLLGVKSKLLERPIALILTLGFLGALSIFAYSMLSAYADGRYFWIAYPFMIPLACLYIDQKLKSYGTSSELEPNS